MSPSEKSRHSRSPVAVASAQDLSWSSSAEDNTPTPIATVRSTGPSAAVAGARGASVRSAPTIVGWQPFGATPPHGSGVASEAPVDAEFIDSQVAPPPPPRGWTGGPPHVPPPHVPPPAPPELGASGATELALIEPSYTSPPLPPWLRVTEASTPRDGVPDELVMLTAPDGAAAQQFRTLRYRVEREANAQIIAVTSARAREGKSVTAANLALALAEGGRVRVLLVDAALRAPSVAERFGLDGAFGLTAVLGARNDDPRALIDVIEVRRNLYVLPAGPSVAAPHAALASEAAAGLLGSLRRAFRYIVVDASPALGPAETLAWQGMIDRYILVARQGVTTTEDLARAADRISREKILGVTLVGVAAKAIAS